MAHAPVPPDPSRAPRPAPAAAAGVAPRALAHDTLRLVDERGVMAREAFDALTARRPIGPRDRDLAVEIVQGVLRREDTLDAVLTLRLKRRAAEQDPRLMRVLRIGAWQILFLDRVPHSAAVSTAVDLARLAMPDRTTGVVNAVLRAVAGLVQDVQPGDGPDPRRSIPRGDGRSTVLAEPAFADPATDPERHLAARYGVPRWIVTRLLAQHGEAAVRQVLEASIARPRVALRPRPGRGADVEAALTAAEIPFEHEGPCLLVRGTGDVRGLPLWNDAVYAVQDPTAAEVAATLAPAEGAAVLDLCAAPGGKTFALAEMVGPSGRVIAVDVAGPRALPLMQELARRGLGNVEVVAADATVADALPAGPAPGAAPGFDLVLVDAPCSNSGVLARRVEARRRLRDGAALASLVALQSRLLDAAATRVRECGRLAWSTCSLDDEENGARVRAFLAAHPEFALVSERTTLPVAGRRDGGYLAVLARRAGGARA